MLADQVKIVAFTIGERVIKDSTGRRIHQATTVVEDKLRLDALIDHEEDDLAINWIAVIVFLACDGLLDLLDFTCHDSLLLLLTDTISVEDELLGVNSIQLLKAVQGLGHNILKLLSDLLILSLLDVARPVSVETSVDCSTESEI